MPHYVSKEKLEELKTELKELQTTRRIDVADKLKKAKEHGDLSENFEYSQAKEEQEALEREIFELEQFIKEAQVVEKAGNKDIVGIGHTVTVKRDGQKVTYTLVGSQESNPAENKLSNTSPIGKVLMGKKLGEKVVVHIPKGEITLEIVSID